MMITLIRMTFITVAGDNDGAVDNDDQSVICLFIYFVIYLSLLFCKNASFREF